MRLESEVRTTLIVVIVAIALYFVFNNATSWLTPKSTISTIVKFDHCPLKKPNEASNFGERAILSDDGSSLVMQCADGLIIAWHENSNPIILGTMTLFDAAKNQKIIPTNLLCPNAYNFTETVCKVGEDNDSSPFQKCTPQDISIKPVIKEDCEVADHNVDRRAYILNDNVSGNFISVTGSRSSLGAPMVSGGGVLLPRNGRPTKLVYIANRKELKSISLENGEMETIAVFEVRNGIWQNSASTGSGVAYSDAYQLLVTSFGGAFMGAPDITLVSAYTIKGDEKWSITGELKAEKSGFSADNANIHLFDGGKFATFNRVGQETFEIIDIKNGHTVGVVSGWPIATSANANKIMIESADGKFSLISWSQVGRW